MRTIAALTLAIIAFFGGTAASADEEPLWGTDCPTGQFRTAEATVGSPSVGSYILTVPGALGCGTPQPGPKYAVATFPPGAAWATVDSRSVRDLASPVGPTEFLFAKRAFPGTGFCLMANPFTKLACVRLVRAGSAVTVLDAPTADPVFHRKIVWDPDPGGPDPDCPSCW